MFLITQSLQCLDSNDKRQCFFLFNNMLLLIPIMDNKQFSYAIPQCYVFLQIVSYCHSWCMFANVQWHNCFPLLSQFYAIMLWHIVILRCLEVLHRKNAPPKCSWSVPSYSSQGFFPYGKSMWQCRGRCHHVALVFIYDKRKITTLKLIYI